jgi:hypothetical protein
MVLKLAVEILSLTNPSKDLKEEISETVVVTTAEAVVAETDGTITGSIKKNQNYERYC